MNQAIKWRLLALNPALAVTLPQVRRKEMAALSPDESMLFLKHALGDRLGAMFSVASTTGMRPGEYMGLKWTDIDLEKGVIVVQRTLVSERNGRSHFAEPKTDRSRRSITLPPSVTRALVDHRRKQAAEKLKAGASYKSNELVFATKKGEA